MGAMKVSFCRALNALKLCAEFLRGSQIGAILKALYV